MARNNLIEMLRQTLSQGGIAADPNSSWNQIQGPFGRMGAGTGGVESREPDNADQIAAQDKGNPAETFAAKGAMAKWSGSPEAFAEWKDAHVRGVPTEWGAIAQHNYDNRMFPMMQKPQFTPEEYEARVQARAKTKRTPGIMESLTNGIRGGR